jgi:hypothetical protein
VPDSAAGKYTRCPLPSCGTIIPVPAAVVDAVLVENTPKPKPRPVLADVDNDQPRKKRRRDDGDDDSPPRRRRRRSRGGWNAGPALAIVAMVIFGVALVGGVGYGVYALIGKKSGSDSAKTTRPPRGWREYSYPEDGFKASFPAAPEITREEEPGPVPFGPLAGISAMCRYRSRGGPGAAEVMVMVGRIPASLPQADRDRLVAEFRRIVQAEFTRPPQMKTVTWLGQQVIELSGDEATVRVVATETAVYLAGISAQASDGHTVVRADPNKEKAFFDNFVLLR